MSPAHHIYRNTPRSPEPDSHRRRFLKFALTGLAATVGIPAIRGCLLRETPRSLALIAHRSGLSVTSFELGRGETIVHCTVDPTDSDSIADCLTTVSLFRRNIANLSKVVVYDPFSVKQIKNLIGQPEATSKLTGIESVRTRAFCEIRSAEWISNMEMLHALFVLKSQDLNVPPDRLLHATIYTELLSPPPSLKPLLLAERVRMHLKEAVTHSGPQGLSARQNRYSRALQKIKVQKYLTKATPIIAGYLQGKMKLEPTLTPERMTQAYTKGWGARKEKQDPDVRVAVSQMDSIAERLWDQLLVDLQVRSQLGLRGLQQRIANEAAPTNELDAILNGPKVIIVIVPDDVISNSILPPELTGSLPSIIRIDCTPSAERRKSIA